MRTKIVKHSINPLDMVERGDSCWEGFVEDYVSESIKGISQADLITFEQLAEAFKEICKNLKTWQELKKATGLSNERAKNIFEIYQKLL